MSRRNLDWFRLRFPTDLDEAAATAALHVFSGLTHRGRVVLDLTATNAGLTHHLAISPGSRGTAIASLRAAVPSLRLIPEDEPEAVVGDRLLLQLSPVVAAIRTRDLPAISAALLSSFQPLEDGAALRLSWYLRSSSRPPLPASSNPREPNNGRQQSLRAKLAEPGLSAYGELVVSAPNPARRSQLMQRTAAVLRSLNTPHGHIVGDAPWFGQLARVFGRRGRWMASSELAAVVAWPTGKGLDLPGLELGASKRLLPAAALPSEGRRLGMSDSGDPRPVAISPKASTTSLMVLGPTGTGKTSLLKNLLRDDLERGGGVALLETNGDLTKELVDAVPAHRVNDVVLLSLTDPTHAVGFNPLASGASPSLIADQISELFHRLWEDFWGPRTAQLVHMGLLTLARRGGATLLDLPRLFVDEQFRESVLAAMDDPVGLEPDWRWFQGLTKSEQATVIAPMLNKVRAFTARESLRAVLGQPEPALSIRDVIEQRKVLIVHMPKGLVGNETAQLFGCLVLTAIWQALAGRAALRPDQRPMFSLVIDEVQDFADSPVPWDELLAQGRKYGLGLTVANQNLAQLPKDFRETVLANARSKAVFALAAPDAKAMERHFAPALSAADLQALDPYSTAALVALDGGGVARPVTLTTPPPLKPLGSALNVREASRRQFARPKVEVERALRAQVARRSRTTDAPVGRKPRRRP